MLKVLRGNCKDLNLLYVEDNKELCERTKEVFENFFKSVEIAYHGQEGLDKYTNYQSANGHPYDLVITDINMPNMNGIELCRKILKQNDSQPIVIVSAHNESNYLYDAIEMGISSFITKPINPERLIQSLHKVTMSINEHKLAESYLVSLETLNIQLEKQNKDLADKNAQLEKSMRLLNTISNKEEIQNLKKSSIKSPFNQESERFKEQIGDFIKDDLSELIDIITEIDLVIIDTLNHIDRVTLDSVLGLTPLFKKYSLTLSMYPFFGELSLAMSDFADTLKNAPLPKNKELIKNCFLLLECFVFDLSRWHDDLRSGDENKLNVIDASNIGNMRLIVNMWLENDNTEVSEDDINDIFDF